MYLPTLYKLTSTGATQTWEISVIDNVITTRFGQLGGKIQETNDTIKEGKNLGKANETDPGQQAILEAEAQWIKKTKKGYVESLDNAKAGIVDEVIEGGIEPMLAHSFEKQGHKIKFPAYISPKLDGVRCVAVIKDGKATLWSRTRKPINSMPHIVAALESQFPTDTATIDGELYHPDYKDDFNKIISLIRPDAPVEGHEIVQYHVFDYITDYPFITRYQDLVDCDLQLPLVRVPQALVESEDEAWEWTTKMVEKGFEGGMIKNLYSPYENKRSYHIQKLKFMQDQEFKIIGIEEGRGKLAGHVGAFLCITTQGVEFKAKLKGNQDYLKTLFDNHSLWKNKQLTVQFQNFTPDNCPRFPVGICIRDYE